MDLSLISQAIMAVWSLLFGIIMFPFRTLQSWLSPVREEPHPEPQQTDDESSSSSPPCSTSPSRYDVFLSFSGKDTRKNFTGHLYHNLDQTGIRTFMDDEEMEEGEEIGSILSKAIKESRISITIFSVNYASSKWCLNELVQIMECKDQQTVLPIFYDVDPRDVRKQMGDFGKKFEKLAKSSDAKTVESWRKALKKAGGLKGWDLKNWHEPKLIETVIERVLSDFRNAPLDASKNLVGIDSHVEDMKRLLNVGSRGVRIVGICGMGGVGKTTLAEVVFHQIFCNFEGGSFLGDVREVSKESRGLVSLQKQLLSDILKREIQSISSVASGKFLIEKGLQTKKVIIVLDDVDTVEQLEALAGECNWFGDGSRLIITTRDEHVLNTHKVHEIYKLKELDFGSSLQLFSKHAFGKDYPPKDHENLAKDVARTAGGLPLALKVLGSFLNDKDIPKEWISFLESLKKIHPDDIMKKLKISYDGLNEEEREIFLDIACFFIGSDKKEAIYIWKGSGFSPEIKIKNLIQKSLIYINIENKLKMHDQLRDMAMQIIRQEQLDEPGERSRLWLHDEVLNVLKHLDGTKKVKGLLLKLEKQAIASEENCIYTEAFTAMSKLRLLCIDNANLVGSFKHFPSELRWFSWKRCPLECLPTDFHLENLVVLDLSYSKITQVWNGPHQNKTLPNVKVLRLGNCPNLTETTDFSRLPNLVVLNLEGCSNLTELPGSICKLTSLESLILSSCSSLKKLPGSICKLKSLKSLILSSCSSLEMLPGSICKLKFLKSLILSSCSSLENLPRDLGDMESLTVLLADKTAIEYLPESIGDLKRLRRLCLNGCESLSELPDFIGIKKSSIKLKLKVLELAGCNLLCRLPVSIGFAINLTTLTLDRTNITELSNDIVLLENLKTFSVRCCEKLKFLPELPSSLIKLDAHFCSSMERLPDLSNLTNMKYFNLSYCERLQSLPELPSSLIHLFAEDCSSMERLPDLSNLTNLTRLQCGGPSITELPNGIALLEKLEHLSVSRCRKLMKLPDAIGRLSSLRHLSADKCNLSKGGIPTAIGKLSLLRDLYLDGNNFNSLPATISDMSSLKLFSVGNCRNLQSLPELPPLCLRYINASNCTSLEILPDLSNLKKLEHLNLGNCEKLVNIQGSEGLKSLKFLYMNGCISVESLLEFPNFNKMCKLELGNCEKLVDIQGIEKLGSCTRLNLSGCSRIPADTLRKCIVYMGNQSLDKEILLCFPGNKTPDWFTLLEIRQEKIIREDYWDKRIIRKEEIIRMVGPSRHSNGEQHHQKKMMEILLCFVFFNPREENLQTEIYINNEASKLDTGIYIRKKNGDQICLLRIKGGEFEGRDEIFFILKLPFYWEGEDLPIVKKAGMHVLYYEKEGEEENDDNYTTTVQSAYERIADFFFPLNDGDGESNSSSSHRKRNNSHLLSHAREGGYFFAGKSKRQKKE